MKNILLSTLAIITITTITSLPASQAQACGNSERYGKKMLIEHKDYSVMRADEYLQQYRWSLAIDQVQGVYPKLRGLSTDYQSTEDLELQRAAKIAAISTIRLSRHRAKGDKLSARMTSTNHIAWATKTLEHLSSKAPDDPELVAFYADALALEPTTKAKARTMLSDLHKRDLLPHAYSYALLSKLQADAKDERAAKDAITRCLSIATDSKWMCNTQFVAAPLPVLKVGPRKNAVDKTKLKSRPMLEDLGKPKRPQQF